MELVKTLLTHKDLLNPKTRILARKIIDKVVQELRERLKVQVETAITGAIRRDRHSPRRVYRNLDLKTTVRRNLKNYHAESGKLLRTCQGPAGGNGQMWSSTISLSWSTWSRLTVCPS